MPVGNKKNDEKPAIDEETHKIYLPLGNLYDLGWIKTNIKAWTSTKGYFA